MSSENYVRIIMVENLRFLGEGSSALGKSEAKARPKGVVDAQTVDIPLPPKLLSKLTLFDSRTQALVDLGVREFEMSEVCDAKRREKVYVLVRCPYRKPTQVDEERILRPAGEGLLRNSAS